MKMIRFISIGLIFVLLALPAAAGDGVAYDFDEVEVVYAAEFTVSPVSSEIGEWFTDMAGGPDKPLQVLYGVVYLRTLESPDQLMEEFIKISGENGSERFLANSMATGWYDPETYTRLQYMKTLFWSAKKLDGNTVVKDFSPPIKSVILKKNFDTEQVLSSIVLFFSFSEDGEKADQGFWSDTDPAANVYEADMMTMIYFGDPTVRNGE